MKQVNWINSWKSNRLKNKWVVKIRAWKLTIFELEYNITKKDSFNQLRVIILNFGFEI